MEEVHSVKNLSETESGHLLVERSPLRNYVEQVSVLSQLESYILDLTHLKTQFIILAFENERLSVCNHLYDILVLDVAQNIGFLFEVSFDLCFRRLALSIVVRDDLQGHVRVLFVLLPRVRCEKHFGRKAFAQDDLVEARLDEETTINELFLPI